VKELKVLQSLETANIPCFAGAFFWAAALPLEGAETQIKLPSSAKNNTIANSAKDYCAI
jgi:hypothetical protein